MLKLLKIGSRDSQLALLQSEMVKTRLEKIYPNLVCEIIKIKTQGDKILDVALSKIGDKGLFVKELETELLGENIDIAVHSMKDMPTQLPDGLKISSILEREDVRDVVCLSANHLAYTEYLESNSLELFLQINLAASSSLRRVAQLRSLFPQINFTDIRGNLNTRFRKLDDKDLKLDAIILAAAGIKRLSTVDSTFTKRISAYLDPKTVLPAVAQGALAIEFLESRPDLEELFKPLINPKQELILKIERNFLNELEGGCQVPVGIYSEIKEKETCFHASVSSIDGTQVVKTSLSLIDYDLTPQSGRYLAQELIKAGAKQILENLR